MTRTGRRAFGAIRGRGAGIVALGLGALLLVNSRAGAQWPYGGGVFGYPFFPVYQTPAAVEHVNQRALIQTQAAYANQAQSSIRVPVPNRGGSRGRDVTFFERYDLETRQAMEDRVARRPSRPPTPVAAPAPTTVQAPEPRTTRPLSSFFNQYEQVVWPADAPTEGDLGALRQVADNASQAALRESRERGFAEVATVTDARNKLLAYGRPALQFVREHTNTTVSDSFHAFLLGLYDALERAATGAGGTGS